MRGFEGSSRLMDGLRWDGSLKEDSFLGFAFAIVLFALATSLFFTPLPIYLKEVFGGQEQFVYLAYILNSVGATAGYFLIRGRANSMNIRKQMPRFILMRSVLVFALVAVISIAFATYNYNLYSSGLLRFCLCNVLHYDAFSFNGGYT